MYHNDRISQVCDSEDLYVSVVWEIASFGISIRFGFLYSRFLTQPTMSSILFFTINMNNNIICENEKGSCNGKLSDLYSLVVQKLKKLTLEDKNWCAVFYE